MYMCHRESKKSEYGGRHGKEKRVPANLFTVLTVLWRLSLPSIHTPSERTFVRMQDLLECIGLASRADCHGKRLKMLGGRMRGVEQWVLPQIDRRCERV